MPVLDVIKQLRPTLSAARLSPDIPAAWLHACVPLSHAADGCAPPALCAATAALVRGTLPPWAVHALSSARNGRLVVRRVAVLGADNTTVRLALCCIAVGVLVSNDGRCALWEHLLRHPPARLAPEAARLGITGWDDADADDAHVRVNADAPHYHAAWWRCMGQWADTHALATDPAFADPDTPAALAATRALPAFPKHAWDYPRAWPRMADAPAPPSPAPHAQRLDRIALFDGRAVLALTPSAFAVRLKGVADTLWPVGCFPAYWKRGSGVRDALWHSVVDTEAPPGVPNVPVGALCVAWPVPALNLAILCEGGRLAAFTCDDARAEERIRAAIARDVRVLSGRRRAPRGTREAWKPVKPESKLAFSPDCAANVTHWAAWWREDAAILDRAGVHLPRTLDTR